jgi:hypothetical protein
MNVRDERPLIGYLLRSYRKRQLRMFALVGAGAGRPTLDTDLSTRRALKST